MGFLINLIAAIILFFIPVKILGSGRFKTARHPFKENSIIYINPALEFLLFSVFTSMVFLGPLSLAKYAYWIIVLLYMVLCRIRVKIDSIVIMYILFILWAMISALFISSVKFQASMMIIKYTLPLLYLWLGYAAITDDDDLLYFMKATAICMCIYALVIGGFSSKFMPFLYGTLLFKSGGLFISYASLADFFSGLIVVPIALYVLTKGKKWLFVIAWICLSTILETVRTGVGGIFMASALFAFVVYKLRSLPWIVGIASLVLCIIFTVPSFHKKMFKDENMTYSSFSVNDASFDNIQSNAREYLWTMNMERFFVPSPIIGSGLGESVEYTKDVTILKLIHSDYVQILCDLGLLGLLLFAAFTVVVIVKILYITSLSNAPPAVIITGAMALGSCGGTFFSMGFDNVIAYSQQSFVLPFVLIGIFLRTVDNYKYDESKK